MQPLHFNYHPPPPPPHFSTKWFWFVVAHDCFHHKLVVQCSGFNSGERRVLYKKYLLLLLSLIMLVLISLAYLTVLCPDMTYNFDCALNHFLSSSSWDSLKMSTHTIKVFSVFCIQSFENLHFLQNVVNLLICASPIWM